MPIDLICLDADDTLWHNMRFFHATQDALVRMLEPFADAGIARSRWRHAKSAILKLYGYGAKALPCQ
jgi:putative hydrolase of the HAD superfamily